MATCHKCGTRKLKKRYCKHCGPLPSHCRAPEMATVSIAGTASAESTGAMRAAGIVEGRGMPEMWAVQKEGRFVPGVLATNEHKTKLQAREREEWVSWELMEYMGYRIVRVKVEEVG